MSTTGLPHTESDLVLADVKAQPLRGGLRPALTPDSGRARPAASGTVGPNQNNKTQVSTVSGDCRARSPWWLVSTSRRGRDTSYWRPLGCWAWLGPP
jgi:hypothetical protein